MNMKEITIRKLCFGSHVKLFFLSGIGFGMILGIPFLLIGLFGGPVNANIGDYKFTGIAAGIVGLLLSPILCGCGFAWFSVCMYPPFLLVLKIMKGITFTGEAPERRLTDDL